MLLLPCALGEFRWNAKQSLWRHTCGVPGTEDCGLPRAHHQPLRRCQEAPKAPGDLGSVGDFAAGSEMAFVTLLQRSYALLGARMRLGPLAEGGR